MTFTMVIREPFYNLKFFMLKIEENSLFVFYETVILTETLMLQ
jgi:hypothetical protein